jgi:spore coat protein U-like protein
MKAIALALLVLLACLVPRPAGAQVCSLIIDDIAFGTVDPLSPVATDIAGAMRINCTGFAFPYVRLCLSFGAPLGQWNPRQMHGGANQLGYEIYSDAARTSIWESLYTSSTAYVTVDLALTSGAGGIIVPTYPRLLGAQTGAPPAAYSAQWTTNDAAAHYVGYSSTPPTCNTGWSAARTTFTATATVAANCTVSASNIDFGSIGLASNAVNATGVVTATCTNGSSYTLGLSAGLGTGASFAQRRMTRAGGSETLGYGLYRDSGRTQVWGDGSGGSSTVSGTGTGAAQTSTVYATLPAQSVQVGSYADTITVTVTF